MAELIKIREAIPSDLPDLIRVSLASRKAAYKDIFPKDSSTAPTAESEHKRFHSEWLDQSDKPDVGLAFIENHPVAYVIFTNFPVSELLELHCYPAWWGRGVGFALFRYAEERLHKPFTLFCLAKNDRARSFYERQGGVLTGRTICVFSQIDVQFQFGNKS